MKVMKIISKILKVFPLVFNSRQIPAVFEYCTFLTYLCNISTVVSRTSRFAAFIDRSVHEAMSPVSSRRSGSSSPLSLSDSSFDIWAGLDLDHIHRFTEDENKRSPPSKQRTTIAARQAVRVADPVPTARTLVFRGPAQRPPTRLFFI